MWGPQQSLPLSWIACCLKQKQKVNAEMQPEIMQCNPFSQSVLVLLKLHVAPRERVALKGEGGRLYIVQRKATFLQLFFNSRVAHLSCFTHILGGEILSKCSSYYLHFRIAETMVYFRRTGKENLWQNCIISYYNLLCSACIFFLFEP